MCAPLILALAAKIFPDAGFIAPDLLDRLIVYYGVLMLVFFSGARLGLGVRSFTGAPLRLWPPLLGPVLALIVLLQPFLLALAFLIVGFGALGAWEAWARSRGRTIAQYQAMRTFVTVVICLALVAIFVVSGVNNTK